MALLFGILLLFTSIHAGTTCDAYISVKASCSSCDPNASCAPADGSVWCSCKAGYAGDGLTCTAASLCSGGSCCPATQTWDNIKQCCTSPNLCASLILNLCDPKETCTPTQDHYMCQGVNRNNSLLPGCNGQTCSAGQDCQRFLDGSVRCVDPCLQHQEVDNSWRADNYSTGADVHEDRYLHGWFHFIGNSGSRLLEKCTGNFHCGAASPVVLTGGHPTLAQGIVRRHGSFSSKCSVTSQIYVKACPNNFFVYKLMGLYYPGLGYCMDHTTVAVPACSPTCAQDESCLWVTDSWQCILNPVVTTVASGVSALVPSVSCSLAALEVSVLQSVVEGLGYTTIALPQTTDPNCMGSPGSQDPAYISINTPFLNNQCGLQFTANASYVTISSTLSLVNGDGVKSAPIPFSCTFELDKFDGADMSLASGGPRYSAIMTMYSDAAFSVPNPQLGTPNFDTGNTLYVKMALQQTIDSLVALVLNRCNVTITSQESVTEVVTIIEGGTPVAQSLNAVIIENGDSSQMRFSFVVSEDLHLAEVFSLQCQVSLCVKNSGNCLSVRSKRSVLGPERLADGGNDWIVSYHHIRNKRS